MFSPDPDRSSYDPDPGRPGLWGTLRRVLGDTDNPLGWSLPLYSLFGIAVRLHLLFVAYIVVRLLSSAINDQLGLGYTALLLGALFGLVLLHEYGHCLACRWVGGEADRILLWPLGGLAFCRPPDTWRAELITVLGGPGVNLVLVPVFGAAVWLVTGTKDAVLFDPRSPSAVLARPELASWTAVTLFSLHYINLLLLLFNVLLPMFPMDGGRILQCLLWARVGKRRSMHIATTVGLGAAVVVGMASLLIDGAQMLLAIALFSGITCYFEKRRLAFIEHGAVPGVDVPETGGFQTGSPEDRAAERAAEKAERAEEKVRARRAKEDDEIDAILSKISRDGRESLTGAERRTLERATRRRQQE